MQFKSQDYNQRSFTVKLRDDQFRLEQDVEPYIEHAKQMREMEAGPLRKKNYRPLFIIPDIVAIEILTKYGIDIHAPEFMHDTAAKARLKRIVISEYPKLLMSNIVKV